MAFNTDTIRSPAADEITELQRKIQQLDGDTTSYFESTQATMKKNQELIRLLKQEVAELQKEAALGIAGDEDLIREAFHNRGKEKDAYRNMSGKEVVKTLEQKVLTEMKRLNAQKHATQNYRRCLEDLKEDYQRMNPEGAAVHVGGEPDPLMLRSLENSLEKTQIKWKEAMNIMTNYIGLKRYMQEESMTFQGQLDSREARILKHKEELRHLQIMNEGAQIYKESAKTELQEQEELLQKERKDRDRILSVYRKNVEECKAQCERIERRVPRTTLQADELSNETQGSTDMAGEEDKSSTLEEAFQRIKEATGVTDIQDVVERFTAQQETYEHLEKVKEENEETLVQLKQQRSELNSQCEELKYSGESKWSSDQQMLEECEQELKKTQERCSTAKDQVDLLVQTLRTVRAGVEHLADKLQHIPLTEHVGTGMSADSDEFVVELMKQCELKLVLLQQELHGKEFSAIMKEMEEEEFLVRIEGNLPVENTRVNLPDDHILGFLSDDDQSDAGAADVLSREAVKRHSQMIIDKSKKKPWKKK